MADSLLIVDDARFARLMIRSYIERLRPGATILEASDGQEALAVIERTDTLDWCTIDYNMPGDNGLVVAEKIRALRPNTRLAVITANVQDALRQRIAEAGIHFIAKPVTEAKLAAFFGGQGGSP